MKGATKQNVKIKVILKRIVFRNMNDKCPQGLCVSLGQGGTHTVWLVGEQTQIHTPHRVPNHIKLREGEMPIPDQDSNYDVRGGGNGFQGQTNPSHVSQISVRISPIGFNRMDCIARSPGGRLHCV